MANPESGSNDPDFLRIGFGEGLLGGSEAGGCAQDQI